VAFAAAVPSSSHTTTTGNTLIVFTSQAAGCGSETIAFTDDAGDSFVQQGSLVQDSGQFICMGIAVAKNITGHANNTVTATWSANAGQAEVTVFEVHGGNATNPVRDFQSGANTSGTSPTVSTASLTVATNDIVVAGAFHAVSASTWAAQSGFTLQGPSSFNLAAGEYNQSATTGAVSMTISGTNAGNTVLVIGAVTIKS
jgi:hypothetical protein